MKEISASYTNKQSELFIKGEIGKNLLCNNYVVLKMFLETFINLFKYCEYYSVGLHSDTA